MKETTNVLLEGVPNGIYLDGVRSALLDSPGVRGVHDLHVWALTSDAPSLSAHLLLAEGVDADETRSAVAKVLDQRFDIEHVTLQTELIDCREGRDHHGLH